MAMTRTQRALSTVSAGAVLVLGGGAALGAVLPEPGPAAESGDPTPAADASAERAALEQQLGDLRATSDDLAARAAALREQVAVAVRSGEGGDVTGTADATRAATRGAIGAGPVATPGSAVPTAPVTAGGATAPTTHVTTGASAASGSSGSGESEQEREQRQEQEHGDD